MNTRLLSRWIVFAAPLAAACFLASSPSLGAGTGGFQARTWDVDVKVPAGAWRAGKTIDLVGGLKVSVQPGVFIEDAAFISSHQGQRWEIDGAFLRKVRIAGDLGTHLTAANSVFEECSLDKNGGWFVAWWGTRWKYENCVFTKKFMRGDFGVHDYAVRATRCTFIGIKLPAIGVKGNPAEYLQRGDMGFDHCRFIACEVPETFLAATVDGVFEGCRFPAKRHDWGKETGPLKVRAYYAGLTGPPKSFINGPLSVEFAPAPAEFSAGSTLAFTHSAGRVTLTGVPAPGQFANLGALPKRASEIPEGPAAIAPTSALPAAATSSLPPAAKGAEIRSLDELVRLLPATIELFKNSQPNISGIEAANTFLARTFAGRPVALRMTLETVRALKDEAHAFQATGRDQAVLTRGITLPARGVALFRADQAVALNRVQKGSDITVRGVVQKVAIEGREKGLVLTLTIQDSQAQ